MDANEDLARAETDDVGLATSPNPAWPFLAIVGWMYLLLAPACLLINAPHAMFVSLSMFLFAVCTLYLASRPYHALCRTLNLAWGSMTTFVSLFGLLAAWRTGRMDAAFASLLALVLVSQYFGSRSAKVATRHEL